MRWSRHSCHPRGTECGSRENPTERIQARPSEAVSWSNVNSESLPATLAYGQKDEEAHPPPGPDGQGQ